MKIYVDYQDEDTPTVEAEVDAVPRIGEKIGVRQPHGMTGNSYALDFVVDVRHYLIPTHEIRVITSSRP